MKKILSLLLVLTMLLGFAGCMPSATPQVTTEPAQTTLHTDASQPEETEPPTEVSTEATEPEETQAPTEAPEPEPTQPKPTQPTEQEDPRPRPTEPQEPHETEPEETEPEETEPEEAPPAPQKSYTGKEEVAAYIAEHGWLPDNFITKSEAKKLGWKSGSLEKYAPGMCIGGDRFGNREGLLPAGKTYYECDIDTLGASKRGAKRIVFTKDGDIYYTSDHYASFQRYIGPNQWEDV